MVNPTKQSFGLHFPESQSRPPSLKPPVILKTLLAQEWPHHCQVTGATHAHSALTLYTFLKFRSAIYSSQWQCWVLSDSLRQLQNTRHNSTAGEHTATNTNTSMIKIVRNDCMLIFSGYYSESVTWGTGIAQTLLASESHPMSMSYLYWLLLCQGSAWLWHCSLCWYMCTADWVLAFKGSKILSKR